VHLSTRRPKMHRSRSYQLDRALVHNRLSELASPFVAVVQSFARLGHLCHSRPLPLHSNGDVEPSKSNDRPNSPSQRLLFPTHLVLLGRSRSLRAASESTLIDPSARNGSCNLVQQSGHLPEFAYVLVDHVVLPYCPVFRRRTI